MAKRTRRHLFTEAQIATLKEFERTHGSTRDTARLVLKQAVFRYAGAPKRTIGAIANKLWKLRLERQSDPRDSKSKIPRTINLAGKKFTVGGEADGVIPASRPFRFEGSFEGDEFRFTIIGKMEHLKAFISKFS